MSTEGSATIVVVPAALLAGAVALAVGGVILVAEGAMWCGRQLHARYEARVNSWNTGQQRVIAASQLNRATLDSLLAQARASYLRTQANRPPDPYGPSPAALRALDEENQMALERARTYNPEQATDQKAQREELDLRRERAALAMEIAIARAQGITGDVVVRAEAALGGPLDQVQRARHEMKSIWATVTDTGRQRRRQRDLASANLMRAEMGLASVKALSDQGQAAITPEQVGEISQIEREVGVARGRLVDAPQRALDDSEALLKRADAIREEIEGVAARAGAQGFAQAARLEGRLGALRELAADAGKLQYAPGTDVERWERLIAGAEQALSQTRPDLSAVERSARGVESEVFAAIERGQQRALAGQIAEEMAAHGFREGVSDTVAPRVEDLGEGEYRVTGLRNDAQPGMGRDDKLVTFTLTANGAITYDFSGYVGDACHGDAQAIFEGLRRRGIIIVDERWQAQQPGSLTYEQAQARAPLPTIAINKDQALVTNSIVAALREMGYGDNDIHLYSLGGETHINADRQGIGYYHMSVDSQGETKDQGRTGGEPLPAALREAIERPRPIETPPIETPRETRAPQNPEQVDEDDYISGTDSVSE